MTTVLAIQDGDEGVSGGLQRRRSNERGDRVAHHLKG